MVEMKALQAKDFKSMVIAGAENLTEHVDLINSLNVFPVPDGDTGTNMNMSFVSGANEMRDTASDHVGELSKALARGLLMGARGNSGVILSQIFRGFSQAIQDEEKLTGDTFAAAFIGGVESAYKAVMKPVEGTILTVARESALQGEKKAKETDDIIEIFEAIVRGAQISLEKTPDLLPVLKQVGVVDSGGKGLLTIYEGMLANLKGEVLVDTDSKTSETFTDFDYEDEHPLSMDDITYGYCTEIMVSIGQGATTDKVFDLEAFRNTLSQEGDSLLVIADDDIIKVHVHTEDPGKVMQLGQQYGELIRIKVDNMREQVREIESKRGSSKSAAEAIMDHEHKPYAIIGVAAGAGLVDLFKSMGVTEVIEGGQTMNPSTQDFIDAIERVNADNIIILPNNSNIIMAAQQAAEASDIPAAVLPTKTIPQGITALVGLDFDATLEENIIQMTEMISDVSTGQITYAIRDTEIDGIMINKDDYMGLIDGTIRISTPDITQTFNATLESMLSEDSEILTIIVGEDGDLDFAEQAAEALMSRNDDIDVDIVEGLQPVYHYILAVE